MAHLTEETARALARRFGAEIDHLQECAECRTRLRSLAAGEDRTYRVALSRAAEGTLRRLPGVRAEKAAAPDLLADLMRRSMIERETALALEPRFQSYALATYVLKRCEAVTPRNPDEGRALARLARTIASQVDPRSCGGTAALADLEAYALAMEGDALRLGGDPGRGLRLFAEARLLQQRGGADPELGARIDLLEALLRRDLGQMKTGLELLDQAAEAFVALKEHDQLARILLHRSTFLHLRPVKGGLSHLRMQAQPPARRLRKSH